MKLDSLDLLAQKSCEGTGCVVYDLDYIAPSRILRLFIDREDRPIDVEDCSKISQTFSRLLDEKEDLFAGEYTLEVSSPGLERPLKKTWHFQKAIGKKIQLKLFEKLGAISDVKSTYKDSKNLVGNIVEVKQDKLCLELDGDKVELPYDKITKANLIFEMK